jgi:hypothetical protein
MLKTVNQLTVHFKDRQFVLAFSCIVLFLVYLSPFLLFGQGVHIWTHDNLDSNVVWNKTLAESGALFSPNNAIIPNIMTGVPRGCFISEYSFIVWLYYFFSPFAAYVLNFISIHTVAFIGAVLLLKKHILKNESSVFIYPLALCFALMPFWVSGSLSIAGQPLLLYCFLNIRNRTGTYVDWVIILAFPFFSFLVLSPFFFVICLGIVWLSDVVRFRKMNFPFFAALFLITGVYLLVEYRLVLGFFVAPDFISHRIEFNMKKPVQDFTDVIGAAFDYFKSAQYHANSIHYPFLFTIALIGMVTGFVLKKKQAVAIALLFVFSAAIMLFFKLLDWQNVISLTKNIKFLNEFQVDRFYTLFPLLWLLMSGLAFYVVTLSRKKMILASLVLLLGCQVVFSLYSSPEFRYTYSDKLFHSNDIPPKYPSYRDFYAENTFRTIKEGIGLPQSAYHTINIGIDPAITCYNGFYTLDMYMPIYPLSYKKKFREVMALELEKNAEKKKYFDNWGSRCYLFPAEADSSEINHLELDYTKLKAMDCRFLFSAKKINNSEKDLQFIYCVKGNRALKSVYIYKLI